MEENDIFNYFYEKSDNELLVEKATEIIARTSRELPNNPILFLNDYKEEERSIISAYRELILQEDPFAASPTSNQVQEPIESPVLPPYSPPRIASPLVEPSNNFERAFFQSAKNIVKTAMGKEKFSPIQATDILLNRAIVRYYDRKFYVFDGSVFQNISDDQMGAFVHRHLYDLVQLDGSPHIIKNVISTLRTHPATQITQTTDHPDQIYCMNGVLQISTGVLRPINPRLDFFTNYVPVAYSQSQPAVCPQMDQFLATCFGGKDILVETAWEMLGYLLTSDISAKCFFVLVGVGNSGKSVLCRLIGNLFGPGSVSYCSPDQLKGRFGSHSLRDSRLNICAEVPYGRFSHELVGLLKGMSGNDLRMAEQKFHDPQQLNPTCKFLFASNFRLQIAGDDEAFWNRVVVLPFSFAVPPEQQDKGLLDKLLSEAPGIVAKAIAAFRRLRERNYTFLIGNGNTQPVNGVFTYVDNSELIEGFVRDRCEFVPDCFTPTSLLHQAYISYCSAHDFLPSPNVSQFSKELNRLCGGRIRNDKKRVAGVPTNGYYGICLRE